MRSPTGYQIRNDSEGSGHLGAGRGDRIHRGVDYLCFKNQKIVAPFNDFKIVRIAYPNPDMIMKGVKWSFGKSTGRLYYFIPDEDLIGETVSEGRVIGIAQAVSEYYELPDMKNHVHFQVNS